MLNKGPNIVTAVRVLDDILRRMAGHQRKKRQVLRPLQLARMFGSQQKLRSETQVLDSIDAGNTPIKEADS